MAVIGFLGSVVEVYILLGYDAASMAVSFLTFRDNAVVSSSKVRISKKNFTSSSVPTLAYFN
jgi:hypothetical protein